MTAIIEQINTQQLADHLRELQSEFKQYDGLQGYLDAKPLNVDFEVNKNDIVIHFDLSKDDAVTVKIKTEYNWGELVNVEINYIEIDDGDEPYSIDDEGSDLLLQCKRIIHDAVFYKLLDEEHDIETNFYSEVYA